MSVDNPPATTKPKGIPIEDLIYYRKEKKLSLTEIAAIVGCSEQNVQQRLEAAELESLDNYREQKDHVFEHLQRSALKDIAPEDIKRLNPLQRITAAAILQDKIATIRGQATSIIENRTLSLDLSKAYEAMKQSSSVATQETTQDAQVIDIVDCPGKE